MNRRSILVCLLAFGIAAASGQEHAASPRARLQGLRGRAVDAAPAPPAGQAWSTDYAQTPDTGLISHSSVYDPATNLMIVFGGIDFGAEATVTNAVLQYN